MRTLCGHAAVSVFCMLCLLFSPQKRECHWDYLRRLTVLCAEPEDRIFDKNFAFCDFASAEVCF